MQILDEDSRFNLYMETSMTDTEWFHKLQTIAGFMKMRKVRVIRFPLPYIGRRKRAQLISGRTRI